MANSEAFPWMLLLVQAVKYFWSNHKFHMFWNKDGFSVPLLQTPNISGTNLPNSPEQSCGMPSTSFLGKAAGMMQVPINPSLVWMQSFPPLLSLIHCPAQHLLCLFLPSQVYCGFCSIWSFPVLFFPLQRFPRAGPRSSCSEWWISGPQISPKCLFRVSCAVQDEWNSWKIHFPFQGSCPPSLKTQPWLSQGLNQIQALPPPAWGREGGMGKLPDPILLPVDVAQGV